MTEREHRELDVRVARDVMREDPEALGFEDGDPKGWVKVHISDGGKCVDLEYWPKPYSTDIAAAWEVMKKLHQEGKSLHLEDADPLAICKAALAAMEK
jgi:hypothetical protein